MNSTNSGRLKVKLLTCRGLHCTRDWVHHTWGLAIRHGKPVEQANEKTECQNL